MKKQGLFVLVLLFVLIIGFLIFTKAGNNYNEEEILKIGEEKYLKFLWIVDGAFNSERMGGNYTVNSHQMKEEDIIFTCDYTKKNKETCKGNNFAQEFNNLFSKSIRFNDVYSDNGTFNWLKYDNNNFYFTNSQNCSVNRMNLDQSLTIKSVSDDKIVYRVSYDKDNMLYSDFVLVKENNDWKIKKAYYHDMCDMEYYIE